MTDNFAAEQSVVGSALIDPACVPDVLQIVKADDFRAGLNREIFEAIVRLFMSGSDVDPVVVIDDVKKHGGAGDRDIERYVLELMELTPTAANVKRYARIVHDNAQRRRIADLADEISDNARFAEDVGSVVSGALTALQTFAAEGGTGIVDGSAASRNFRTWIDAAREDPDHAVVRTRFASLDNLLGGGLVKTGLYVIGARPGMGKTTAALNLATNIAAYGRRVLFVSLEMSEIQITTKRVAMWSGIPFSALYNGRIGPDDEDRVEAVVKQIEGMPLDIAEDGIRTVADLAAFLQTRRKYDAVFVDYLGILSPAEDDRQKPRYEQITNISADLKRLAKRLGIPIVVLSQLNRENGTRRDKRPTLTDLRDTGAIEQDADGVFLLHRAGYYQEARPPVEDIEFILAKNRHGETGTIRLVWHGSIGRIYEHTNREES